MKLSDSIDIPASAEQLWAVIVDPDTWPGWNPKIQTVRRNRRGQTVAGERFNATFKLGQRECPSEIEVLALEPNSRLVLRQEYEFKQRVRCVDVTFTIAPADNAVRLTQVVDMSNTGIWWPLRLLILWIHRFGRPTGSPPLRELRELIAQMHAQGSQLASRDAAG